MYTILAIVTASGCHSDIRQPPHYLISGCDSFICSAVRLFVCYGYDKPVVLLIDDKLMLVGFLDKEISSHWGAFC